MSDLLEKTETIEPAKVAREPERTVSPAKLEAGAKPRGTSYVPRQQPVPRPPRKDEPEDDDGSFFQRHRVGIIVGVALLLGVGAWFVFGKPSAKSETVRKAPEPQVVRIVLPPPPPPPPPPKVQPPPPKEERRMEQAPVDKPVDKPVEKPAEKPPESLGTSIKGGEGMAGLSSGRGMGVIGGTGTGPGGGGGSAARAYGTKVARTIQVALANHRKTRNVVMEVEARVWVDGTGRITRATLDGSTGDSALDALLKNEILPGIQLSEAPPQGMRMPIPMRLKARRP